MHQVILLTAMAATTGLFGGGRHGGQMASCRPCGGGSYSATGTTAPVSYQGGFTSGSSSYPQAQQPAAPAYQPAPQPYPNYQPAPQPYPNYQPAPQPYPGYQPAAQPYPTYQPAAQPYPRPMFRPNRRGPFSMTSFYRTAVSSCPGGNCSRR